MSYSYYESLKKTEICPICGKHFIPAVEHMWKIGGWSHIEDGRTEKVCSYTCMRKWEKEKINGDRQRRRARRNAKNEFGY